ncbi:response regulator [Bdellovibrio sp. HCB337]|uniref:response regulator n=1 Tax=Bdellovibrio sp. HCB337 TaxID=3394358 RepID=UPI0039A64D00
MAKQILLDHTLKIKDRIFNKYLWGFYTLTVLLLGVLLFASIWFVRSQLKKGAYAQTHSLALALDETNRRQLEIMTIPLEFVAGELGEKGGLEKHSQTEINALLHEAKKLMESTNIRNVFILDQDGRLRASTAPPSHHSLWESYRKRAGSEFDYLKTQKNYTILTLNVSLVDKKRILVLNKTLRDKDGRFVGVIAVSRAMEDFEAFYKTLDLPAGVNFTIFRDDGQIIYRYPADAVDVQSEKVAFSGLVRMGSEGAIEGKSRLDGREKIGYYKFASPYGAMTYVGYTKEAIFSGWKTVSFLVVAVFGIFMGALVFLVNMVRRRQASLSQALNEHHRREDLIRRIQQKTETLTGHDFLRELGLQIAKVFEVKNVAIGVLLPEHANSVRFVVNWVDGAFGTDYIYDLRNTPFDNLKPGEFFVYPKSVSKIFTQDPLLSYRNIESCMGMVLQDSEQRPIGILMVYSEDEMLDLALKRTVLSVFAARAGAELERIHTDEIRKEVERLRKQIEERSSQSEKLEAIGTLAEGIAHDFNNILAIILATTEKLMSIHKASTPDQHYLDSIKRACHRARHLVAQILIFSRREDSTMVPVQIKSIFPEILDFLRSTLPAQIRLSLDLGDCGDLSINADLNQIQQALMNLCVNAARAIGINGGEIRLSLRKAQIKDSPYVKWSLHYSGEEMARDEIEKIFDPFYAQNIGMVVVQRIVTNHQGFIEVKSASGQGTDFDIFLPVVSSGVVEEVKTTPFNFKSAQKVMIVDDEPEIGLLIKELLEIEGLQVETFVDPIKAMKVFTELQSQYFLIISDLSMPGMSGVEFTRKVREMNKHIPLVLWSGYHQFLDEELLELNVKVLSKPVDVQKLLTLINSELSQLSAQDISKEDRAPGNEPEAPKEK